MSQRSPKILLLDANALIHRSYHALPPLTSPKGEMVNAVYGFANALLKAIKDEHPDYVVACFDAGRTTFRNEIYSEYKAHRKTTEDGLAEQFPKVKNLVESLNIPIYAQKGLEADDLIGSLSQIAAKKGLQTVIVTGDNDALQLVDDTTSVYSLRRGVTDTLSYNRELVKEKMGVYPEQIVDYKALAGDSSDNIPGAPGIGPKTAVEWLNKYGTLEGVYQHLDELSERHRNILKDNREQVEMSKRLAAIRTDLDIDLDLPEADIGKFDFHKAVGMFHDFGFKSLITKIPRNDPHHQETLFIDAKEAPAPKIETAVERLPFRAVTAAEELEEICQLISGKDRLVFDTELTALKGELIGIAVAWSGNDAAYVPIAPAYESGLPLDKVKACFKNILGNPEIEKVGHNLKFDLAVLKAEGFEVRGELFDTMIASQLVNSTQFSHNLDDVAFAELGFKKISITELIGKRKQESMASVPLEKLAEYSCEDALITWRLYERFAPALEEAHLKRVFYEIEMPLLPILQRMEALGITVDTRRLDELAKKLRSRLLIIEKDILKMAGREFNIGSPIQLQSVLFNDLGLPKTGIKKTKSGLSTDADSLAKLAGKHPIVELLLEHRELSKLMNTYIEALPKLLDKQFRVHTTFQQIGAATGRLSSTEPNLQNIPIRTELGNEVRKAFIPAKGKVLLGADYSQAELRVLAHISGDEGLIEAFQNGSDFHAAVARELGVDRRTAKAINFGIIYGLGANALARDINRTPGEAKEVIDRYFDTFPGVKRYIDEMKNCARDVGYVSTIFGRRRYLPDIHSPNMMLRAAAERMAVNMPAQGTVADLMKLSMINLEGKLPQGAEMLLQIHDELLFEVEPRVMDQAISTIKQVMSGVAELKVALEVDIKTGPNWGELMSVG